VLLDGNYDWLTHRRVPAPAETEALFDLPPELEARSAPRLPAPEVELDVDPQVHTMIKADLRCAAVAAASVLAKVERDRIMVERARAHPEYAWHENKGYAAPDHGEALLRLGTCPQHRRSWNLRLAAAQEGAGGPAEEGTELPVDVPVELPVDLPVELRADLVPADAPA
jgi:ribonuclease HII